MTDLTFRENLTEAIKYWELRRVLFNLLMIATLLCAVWQQNAWVVFSSKEFLVYCASFAGMANVFYCLAYVPDLALRSSLLSVKIKHRGALAIFVLGCALSLLLTSYISDELVRSYKWYK